MELFIGLPVLLGVLFGSCAFFVYRADPVGWKQTFKRLSKTMRASLESKNKGTLELLPLDDRKAQEDWTEQFTGKEREPDSKHRLIKTWISTGRYSYYTNFNWKCNCGISGGVTASGMGMFGDRAEEQSAKRRSLRDAKNHIKQAQRRESRYGDGDFAF